MRSSSQVDVGGGAASFDDLYRRHAGEATRVARGITGNAHDAADAVAEAVAGVLAALASGRLANTDVVRPYLLAATRNAAIDIVRRAGRVTPTDEPHALDPTVVTAGPSDRLLAGEDRDMVARAFADLPPRWRAVLWLTEVEGLPPRDTAPLLRLTPNAAAQLAARARSRLRERYVQSHVRNHASGDCLETTERLGALLAGQLTTAQANRVRGHLAECAECRARLAELEDVGLALRRATWGPVVPAAALGLRRIGRWWWPWGRHRRRPVHAPRVDSPPVQAPPVEAPPVEAPPAVQAPPVAEAPPVADVARVVDIVDRSSGLVAQLAASPAVQQLAGAVAAGALVVGVGAAVVRHHDAPAGRDTARPAVVLADPPPSTAPPTTSTPTTAAAAVAETTTTTVATTPTTAGPAGAAAPAAFTPRGPLASARISTVAHALGPALSVYDAPRAGAPRLVLSNPRPSGAPLVLLVLDQQPGWLEVLLPVRPNESTGWVRLDQVSLVTHDFQLVVELGAHRITAYQGTQVLVSEPIGVGTAEAPTPGGLYYTTELFQPDDGPDGPYGPYAYGLSGYSDVLYDFAGGDGQFGIHGTNDPSGLGHDISHGCIRMSNAGITRLAGILPLGVPVTILP